jgi:hypothetical protein
MSAFPQKRPTDCAAAECREGPQGAAGPFGAITAIGLKVLNSLSKPSRPPAVSSHADVGEVVRDLVMVRANNCSIFANAE